LNRRFVGPQQERGRVLEKVGELQVFLASLGSQQLERILDKSRMSLMSVRR
jgi:hypothetical protein